MSIETNYYTFILSKSQALEERMLELPKVMIK